MTGAIVLTTTFVDAAASFDYVAYGSLDTYDLSFRIVRFPISDDSYECIVTNLPSDEFPSEQIKLLYYARWAIEGIMDHEIQTKILIVFR